MSSRRATTATPDPQVMVHGDVGDRAVRLAKEKVVRATRYLRDPVLFARVMLIAEADPARERPAVAQAVLDVNGQPVRAHAAGGDMHEAINRLEERLRRQLEILTEHREERRKRGPGPREEAQWRHGDPPARRPPFFPRAAAEREVVTRQASASRPMTRWEAADEMDLLDYSFHLFVDEATGEDALVWRDDDGKVDCIPLASPSPRPLLDQSEAVTMLDVSGARFVFYRDAASGRGAVVYRRYDGHYGILESPNTPR